MALDFPVDLMRATVQIEQRQADGGRTTGTGFLVSSKTRDGRPEVILVTADHVFADMPDPIATVGFRTPRADGAWSFTPAALRIRDDEGSGLWTRHPARDIAAIRVQVPQEFARAAIPAGYLSAEASGPRGVAPGEELMVLGYPKGLASSNAGFPILRAGRVASYPISPAASSTFLLDFSVFPGNSGGPVFKQVRRAKGAPAPVVVGVLTQQVEVDRQRLEIGVVTHARFVAETVGLLETGKIPVSFPEEPMAFETTVPAAQVERRPSPWRRMLTAFGDIGERVAGSIVRPFQLLAARFLGEPERGYAAVSGAAAPRS